MHTLEKLAGLVVSENTVEIIERTQLLFGIVAFAYQNEVLEDLLISSVPSKKEYSDWIKIHNYMSRTLPNEYIDILPIRK